MDELREHIISCGNQLLKESGCQGFSMQKVAQLSELDISYLQPYFKNESALLVSIATSFLESHCIYLNTYQLEKGRDIHQNLQQWLLYTLKYRGNEECDALFKEFWAIALHDREMRLVLDQYYRQLQLIIASKLQIIAPHHSASCLTAASCFLLPFIEGYGVTRSTLPISLLLSVKQLSQTLQILLQD
jgi:DNA-binding transcriptional regulator YbjK